MCHLWLDPSTTEAFGQALEMMQTIKCELDKHTSCLSSAHPEDAIQGDRSRHCTGTVGVVHVVFLHFCISSAPGL